MMHVCTSSRVLQWRLTRRNVGWWKPGWFWWSLSINLITIVENRNISQLLRKYYNNNMFPFLTLKIASNWNRARGFLSQQVEFSSAHLQNDEICLIAFNPKIVYLHCGKKVHYYTYDLNHRLTSAARFTANRIVREMSPAPEVLQTLTDMANFYKECKCVVQGAMVREILPFLY